MKAQQAALKQAQLNLDFTKILAPVTGVAGIANPGIGDLVGPSDAQPLMTMSTVDSPTGKLVFHVFAALAEFERNLIRERTIAGLKAARARGRKGGRPKKLQSKDLKTIKALLKTDEVSVQEAAMRFGVSRSTLYRNRRPCSNICR